ncbi:hypothetical protein D3C78_1100160 [compost metagenome]
MIYDAAILHELMRIAASDNRLAKSLCKRFDFIQICLKPLSIYVFAVQVKSIQSL